MKNEPVNSWYSLLYQNKFWSGSARLKPSVHDEPFQPKGEKRDGENRYEKRRHSRLFFFRAKTKSPLCLFWQGTFLKPINRHSQSTVEINQINVCELSILGRIKIDNYLIVLLFPMESIINPKIPPLINSKDNS